MVCPDSACWVVWEGHHWEDCHQELLGDLRMVEDLGVVHSNMAVNARNAS